MIDPLTAVGVVLLGYLFGSFSFAKIIGRIVAPGKDISKVRYQVPGRDVSIEMNVASATSARYHLGARYGCLISLLDMAKVGTSAVKPIIPAVKRADKPRVYQTLFAEAAILDNAAVLTV